MVCVIREEVIGKTWQASWRHLNPVMPRRALIIEHMSLRKSLFINRNYAENVFLANCLTADV